MAKILRKAYKIFGSSATAEAGGLEQFGGLAAGAVNYTVDVETLQALTAWADGWSAACLGNNSPVLEERNAVDYVHGYQIGYLLQQGIPEWLSTQTYYKNAYVVDSDGKLRVSVIDNNTGNDPELDNGGQYWGFGGGSGSGKAIGEVFLSQSSSAQDNPGSLPLFTGETIASADTVYPEFYNWVNTHADLQISDADYDTAIATYGECPKYVIDTVNKTIRLPKLVNYLKMANTTDKITQDSAGLPNITGTWQAYKCGNNGVGNADGAFTITAGNYAGSAANESGSNTKLNFDASDSSAIYGGSNTVTPAHTTLYPWVCAYNAAVEASVAQAAEFQNALSGKVDLASGVTQSDVDYVVENYQNGSSWYRVWKSGWCEQGGLTASVSGGQYVLTTFLKPFVDTNYSIVAYATGAYSALQEANSVIDKSVRESFSISSGYANPQQYSWYACGYIS